MTETEAHALLAKYWGKAHPDVTGGSDHHTVLGHSLDVAACVFVLIDRHPVLRTQLAASAGIPSDAAAITYAADAAAPANMAESCGLPLPFRSLSMRTNARIANTTRHQQKGQPQ
jgi:hypothetical protein